MRIYDISVPVAPGVTPTYPGDPGIEVTPWASIARGDAANVSLLHFGAHTGTHIDAPAHFIDGAPTVRDLSLEALIGDALVVELPGDVQAIGEEHVRSSIPPGTIRVLFKTRNSTFWADVDRGFREDFTYIDPGGASALAERGVRLVGFDYLSVERFHSVDFETHMILLSKGIVILEGLDLSAVDAGVYELICLPLKIAAGSGDGAPARAILRA